MKSIFLVYGLILMSLCYTASAQVNITWSSSAFAENETSSGEDLDDSFFFAVGGFVEGFVPTADNTDEWAHYWVTHGIVQYDTTELFAGFPNNNFLDTEVLTSNEDPFTLTNSPYIWGFNVDNEEEGEWILANNPSWQWPNVNVTGPSIDATGFSILSSRDENGNLPVAVIGAIRTDTDPEGTPLMTTALVANPVIPIQRSYNDWVAATFPEVGSGEPSNQDALNDDPDGDGHTNFEEYAFGTNPLLANPISPITVVPTTDGSETFDITLKRSPRADISALIETSTTLELDSWSNILQNGTVLVDTPGIFTIRADSALLDARNRFFRAEVIAN